MEYWEFLLQREGDQIWLPLESSQVEILEGRYRVMAHTSQSQTPVQIRITQLLTRQVPPKRRVLRRQGQTNGDGLMVVMPFTWLGEGKWEIHCTSDRPLADSPAPLDSEAGDAPAPDWQHAVQLRVLSHDTEGGVEGGEEWPPSEWPLVPSAEPTAAPATAPATPPIPPASEGLATPGALSETALLAAFQAIDQALSEALTGDATASTRGLGLSTTYRLELAQSALMIHQGRDLTVVGQVVAADPPTESPLSLALRLIDPQTGAVQVLQQQPLAPQITSQIASQTFAVPITLPAALDTCLLLGEVILVAPDRDSARVLATQRFTVTVDVAALFDAIANEAEVEGDAAVIFPPEAARLPDEGPAEAAGTDGEPAKPVEFQPPPRSIPTLLLPRSGLALPPRIYYPSLHEVEAHRPTLPALGKPPRPVSETAPDPISETVPDSAPEPLADPEPQDTPAGAIDAESGAPAEALHPPRVTLPGFVQRPAPLRLNQPPPAPAASVPAPATPPSPVDQEFQSLNLQDRFWSRLNTLAVENYQAAIAQKRDLEAAGVTAEAAPEAASAAPPASAPEASPAPFAGEVVIYDDEEATAVSPAAPPAEAAAPPAEADRVSPPTPIVEVPEGELVAGETVGLTLRVPYHFNRTFLKVWITDPQTRTVVDEPRQVMNLSPDGLGNMAAEVQLTVPLGCVEAWFEAISIDFLTNQESYKATVRRPVVPADVGAVGLEDFEL